MAHEPQRTTVCAWEKTVVMVKQPAANGWSEMHRNREELEGGRTGAFDIHEVGVGGLYEALELVLALFKLGGGVEEVDGESLE
jgi:hypothetical protein